TRCGDFRNKVSSGARRRTWPGRQRLQKDEKTLYQSFGTMGFQMAASRYCDENCLLFFTEKQDDFRRGRQGISGRRQRISHHLFQRETENTKNRLFHLRPSSSANGSGSEPRTGKICESRRLDFVLHLWRFRRTTV